MTKSVMLFFFSKHHHCHVEFPLKLLLIVFDLAQDGTSCHLVWSSASSVSTFSCVFHCVLQGDSIALASFSGLSKIFHLKTNMQQHACIKPYTNPSEQARLVLPMVLIYCSPLTDTGQLTWPMSHNHHCPWPILRSTMRHCWSLMSGMSSSQAQLGTA